MSKTHQNGAQALTEKMGDIEIVLMRFAIKMKHNQILIISIFLENWEIVQTVDNSRTYFGECAAVSQVFIPTTTKKWYLSLRSK